MNYQIEDETPLIYINGQPQRIVGQTIEKISGLIRLDVEPLRKKRRRKTIRGNVRNDNLKDNPYG